MSNFLPHSPFVGVLSWYDMKPQPAFNQHKHAYLNNYFESFKPRVNTMIADDLAPCVAAMSSAAMLLAPFCGSQVPN